MDSLLVWFHIVTHLRQIIVQRPQKATFFYYNNVMPVFLSLHIIIKHFNGALPYFFKV